MSVLVPTVIESEGRYERAYDIYSRLLKDSIIFLGSDVKGKRFMLPHATAMIHQPSSGTCGKVTDQEIDLRESLRIKRLLEEIMARNTGQKPEKIHEDMERHKWLTAEDAKKYGLI